MGKVDAATAKGKVKARVGGDVGLLGCGKCRGAHRGCVQCRSPKLGGVRLQR